MADIRKGRLLDVPAWLWRLPAFTLLSGKVLVSSADVHERRHLVDPNSSIWCLRFGPHLRLKTTSLRWALPVLLGNGYLGRRVAPLSNQYA